MLGDSKCIGIKMVVVGLLFIFNSLMHILDWWLLIGLLVFIEGVFCMVKPCCASACCISKAVQAPQKAGKRKR